MMHLARPVAALLVLTVGACGDPTGSPDPLALAKNRAQWQSQGITSYAFDFQRSCFCLLEALLPVRIRVTDGEVVAVTDSTGQPVDPGDVALYYTVTVDSLFGIVAHAIATDAHLLEVRYHVQLGFPESIAIDYVAPAVDDEVSYRAGNLMALR